MKRIFFVLAILLFPVLVSAQSAKNVYRAVKKIETQTQVGISFSEYNKALVDGITELKLFAENANDKQKEFFVQTWAALNAYKIARDIWNDKIENYSNELNCYFLKLETIIYLHEAYPNLSYTPDRCNHHTAIADVESLWAKNFGLYSASKEQIDRLIGSLWKVASGNLELAKKELKSQ